MRKNLAGIMGVVVAEAVLIMKVTVSSPTTLHSTIEILGAAAVILLGIWAAVVGTRRWLYLSGIGVALIGYFLLGGFEP